MWPERIQHVICCNLSGVRKIDTEYNRAKVPPYNGNDPPPAPGSLKALLFPPLLNEVQNKGTQGVQARYGAELPPLISIVRYPGRPVILGIDKSVVSKRVVSADALFPRNEKTGTRVRSPKPPLYETALLSPSEPFWCRQKGGFQKGGFGGSPERKPERG